MSSNLSDRPSRFLWSIARYPMGSFLLWSTVAALVSLVLYWAVRSGHWPAFLGADPTNAALVDMLLGPAISLSGALVAILLAVYAIRLQEREQHREALRAQVEMFRLISEQTAPFLRTYAQILLHIRRFFAHVEVNSDLFDLELENTNDEEVQIRLGTPIVPVVQAMNQELIVIGQLLDELCVLSNSDAFTSTIARECLAKTHVHLVSDGSDDPLPLDALPTLAVWMRYLTNNIELRLRMPDAAQLVGIRVIWGRMVSASCRNKRGKSIASPHMRLMLMAATMWDTSVVGMSFDKDQEIRLALLEVFSHFSVAVNGPRLENALGTLFKDNEVLLPVLDKLENTLPSLMDPSFRQHIEGYMNERPLLKIVDGKAV